MPFLFDTDALSELIRKRPSERYVHWVRSVPPRHQFVSAISVGELYRGAFRSAMKRKLLERIDGRLLPALNVLPFDQPVARIYGEIRATLEAAGRMPGEPDLQIAATALHHGLTVVTGNLGHFERVPDLHVSRAFVERR